MEKQYIMQSPTYGFVTINQVAKIVADYIENDEKASFDITIGTDSQTYSETKIVEVIAVHKVGKGGIYFYKKEFIKMYPDLRTKIFDETQRSLVLADKFYENLENELLLRNKVIEDFHIRNQIHCDIGTVGATKELIPTIVGWVKSAGYECKIKPESYAASGVANKISK